MHHDFAAYKLGSKIPAHLAGPLNSFDRQTYYPPNFNLVMTDRRLFKVVEARPIDLLVMVLSVSRRIGNSNLMEDEIKSLFGQYTAREVCAMLIQILVDGGTFVFVSEIMKNLEEKVKEVRHNRSKTQKRGVN